MVVSTKTRKKLLEKDDFATYPKWFRKVVARRLLLLLIPDRLSRNLPRWLSAPLFGDNSTYPADLPWPDWMVIPPDFDWPDAWTPWIMLDFDPGIIPDTAFPPDWQPGDPLPPGVTLQPGYVLPADWRPYNLLPPGVLVPPGFSFPPGWTSGDPLPPGVIVPPGVTFPAGWTAGDPLPAGVIVPSGVSFPAGWTAGDPLPAGVIVPSGVSFPSGWTAGDPLPAGVIVPSGVSFPSGWTAGDPLPAGVIIPSGVSFPAGWTAGDPLPAGVIIPSGVSFPAGWTAGDPLPAGVIIPPGASFPPNWTPTTMPPWWAFKKPRIEVPNPDTIAPIDYTWIDPHGPGGGTHTDKPLPSTTVHIYISDGMHFRSGSVLGWTACRDKVNAYAMGNLSGTEIFSYINRGTNYYDIYRSLWKFDLSAIPAGVNIEAGQFWLWGNYGDAGYLCAQKAPNAIWDHLSAYSSGEGIITDGAYFGLARIIINLNATILSYLNANIGDLVYIMGRNYEYDGINNEPAKNTTVEHDVDKILPAQEIGTPQLVLRYRG